MGNTWNAGLNERSKLSISLYLSASRWQRERDQLPHVPAALPSLPFWMCPQTVRQNTHPLKLGSAINASCVLFPVKYVVTPKTKMPQNPS